MSLAAQITPVRKLVIETMRDKEGLIIARSSKGKTILRYNSPEQNFMMAMHLNDFCLQWMDGEIGRGRKLTKKTGISMIDHQLLYVVTMASLYGHEEFDYYVRFGLSEYGWEIAEHLKEREKHGNKV